jgi:Zn-dependent protease
LAFLFVTLHEYGHALVAQWYNLSVVDITLYPIGGVARIKFDYNDYKEELFTVLAGPLVNVILALVFACGLIFSKNEFLFMGIYINAVLVVFNLLPVLPLDGGRIFRAILHKFLGNFVKATKYAVVTGQILAIVLILFSAAYNLWIWVFFFLWAWVASQQEVSIAHKINSFASLKIKLAEVLGREEFRGKLLCC